MFDKITIWFLIALAIIIYIIWELTKEDNPHYKYSDKTLNSGNKPKSNLKSALDYLSEEDDKIEQEKIKRELAYQKALDSATEIAEKYRSEYPDAQIDIQFTGWNDDYSKASFSIEFNQKNSELTDQELLELCVVDIKEKVWINGLGDDNLLIGLLGYVVKDGRKIKLGEEDADRFFELLVKEYNRRGNNYTLIRNKENCYIGDKEELGWSCVMGLDILLEERRSRHIPQKVKDEVWRRDQGRCVQCGSNHNIEYDHIVPFSKGGSNTYRNIQLLCESCNRTKSNKIG